MECPIRVLGTRVAIELDPAEEITKGGILLPDKSQHRPSKGTVIETAPDVETVKIGDVVFVSEYGGVKVKVDGIEFFICSESDIIGVFK